MTIYHEPHHVIAERLANMLDKKRNDYGTENLQTFGELGILIRVWDKVGRLRNALYLCKDLVVKGETAGKTWADIAGYAIKALEEHHINEPFDE